MTPKRAQIGGDGLTDRASGLGRSRRKGIYPAVVLLTALAIGALGVYPHLRFSFDSQSVEYFFYSYDEGYYSTAGLTVRPGRTPSVLALAAVIGLSGGDLEIALMAADLVFPLLAVLCAGLLAAAIARAILPRVAILLGLLFAAEYATHLFNSYLPGWDSQVLGPWRDVVVGAAPILFLFRTPEPQVSWSIAFLFLAATFRLGRDCEGGLSRSRSALFVVMSVLLGLSYFPVLAACLVYAALYCAALALVREWRLAGVLFGGTIVSLLVFALSLVLWSEEPAGGVVFATRAPCLSPLAIVSLAIVAAWIVRIARTGALSRTGLQGLGAALTPVVLLNQQLVTGRAISLKLWEENINGVFVAVGLGCFFVTLATRRQPGLAGRALRQLPAALLVVALLAFVGRRQHDSLGWFYADNAEEAAAASLLDEHYPLIGNDHRVLFDTILVPQRLRIRSAHAYHPIVSYDDSFVQRLPTLELDPAGTGTGSPHAAAVFEFMWRQGVEPEQLRALLESEVKNNCLVLCLFFNHLDAWGPLTTWRATRLDSIAEEIPAIVAAYGEHRRTALRRWAPPVFWVSRWTPEELAAVEGFAHQLVATRTAVDGQVLHLYRQRSDGGAAVAP